MLRWKLSIRIFLKQIWEVAKGTFEKNNEYYGKRRFLMNTQRVKKID